MTPPPHEATPSFQTMVRQKLTPYLPPPVVVAMRRLDPQLEPYVGPEGSVTIFGSLLLAWLMIRVVRLATSVAAGGGRGGGRAVQEDAHDHAILPSDATNRHFDQTMLLCGPSLAGKTSIFYGLIGSAGETPGRNGTSNLASIRTVRSIRSNTGFLETANGKTWRILDTPGHWGPQKLLDATPTGQVDRMVLVVDATQPVASAADYLYALVMASRTPDGRAGGGSWNLAIVSHKNDHPKAKNPRRIKLQLRSELERLSQLRADDPKIVWDSILNEAPVGDSSELLRTLQR